MNTADGLQAFRLLFDLLENVKEDIPSEQMGKHLKMAVSDAEAFLSTDESADTLDAVSTWGRA